MIRRIISLGISLAALAAMPAAAQITNAVETIATPAPSQDFCITKMASFPTDEHVQRYQFFRLTEEMATDATPQFRRAIAHFRDPDVPADVDVLDAIEAIANPVIRQASPATSIAFMGQLIDFAQRCEPFITGQVSSLTAYDNSLSQEDVVIQEDALFLRQVLSDSLFRLKANTDLTYGWAVTDYANSLVRMRDNIEFTNFTSEIDELEALYMTDLDGRLARSNDIINEEMNRETLGDAITLSDDMNKELKRKSDQEDVYTLLRILNRF